MEYKEDKQHDLSTATTRFDSVSLPHDAAIGKAIKCAAMALPDRFYIEIRIDKDGSSVSLCSDPPFEIHYFPADGESLVEQISDAVKFAIGMRRSVTQP